MVWKGKVLKQDYKEKKVVINAEDLEDGFFEILNNRRNVTAQQVNSIYRGLESGKHFNSPFVVHKKNGTYRLIDGNHRESSLRKFFEDNLDCSVEVTLHIYEKLSEEEEKELYTRANAGKKQSTNDFVQQYKEDIPIWHMIQERFPIRVTAYPSKESINFYALVGSYLASIKPGSFQGDFIGKPMEFIDIAKQLDEQDVKLMRAFCKDHLQAFGVFKNNIWFKGTCFRSVMRIWMDNRSNMLPAKMVKYFSDRLAQDYVARELGKVSSMSATRYARDKYIEMLNRDRVRDQFVTDPED